jgi:acetylornithine deacetylase/succinyl-diaminopimelate desuccinylase-like protein
MDEQKIRDFVDAAWDQSIVPALEDYIRIPNLSPAFDPEWQKSGHMDRAVEMIEGWMRARELPGMKLEVVRSEGRTPVIVAEVPGDSEETVLLYGHLDKQPPMEGWDEGLGAWEPVIRDGRLYGRGGADDGYAAYAAVTAIQALRQQGIPHARCVLLIEACEESGSVDLPYYLETLADRIGTPSLIICLDSGCGNYDQLWVTTSLRGLIGGTLSVDILTQGVHSGDASGIVPSSFRILRQLLSRLEDERTGNILPAELSVPIPEGRLQQAGKTAKVLKTEVYDKFPFAAGAGPVCREHQDLILNRTWRPQLEVTGAGGMPAIADAGNVLRPTTAVKVSLRLPPRVEPEKATAFLKKLLESDPPYGARVGFKPDPPAPGWDAPPLAPWLEESAGQGSKAYFGEEACYMGEGGSIPFMGMLGEKFPEAQFLITGVLGPESNAHGPNEFLDIPTGKKLTSCTARVLADHFRATKG